MEITTPTQTVEGVEWTVGDETSLGTISGWFTNKGLLWFTTEQGNQFKAQYLISETWK